MERIKRSIVNTVAGYVSDMLGTEVMVYGINGYFNVDLGDAGRTLKSGTLRECDTYVRGMWEALIIQRDLRRKNG